MAGRAWVAALPRRGAGHDNWRAVVSPGLRLAAVSLGDSSGGGGSRFRPGRGGRTAGRGRCGRSWAPAAAGQPCAAGGCRVLLAGLCRLPPGSNGGQGGLREAGRAPERQQHLGLAPAAPARRSRWSEGACRPCLVTGSGDRFHGGRSGWHGYLSFGCHGRRESCQEHHIESALQVKSALASHGAQLLAGPHAAAAPVINLPPEAPSTRRPAGGPARDAGPGTAKIWRRRPR